MADDNQININTASEDELKRIPGMNDDHARNLLENRPFQDWEDLKAKAGFPDNVVESLRRANVTFG